MTYVAYLVLVLSFINLFRMVYFTVASDLFDIKLKRRDMNSARNSNHFFSEKYRPLVTVIVPAHNEEETLRRNLLSVAESTYKNVELIIVSDSSTDRTLSIAKNFQRRFKRQLKRIKVISLNVHGKALALNKGLRFARGSLFMCLDADSALTPKALEKAVFTFRDKSNWSFS